MAPSGDRAAQRFKVDLAWNYASLMILGASGITLNIVIGLFYDSETLGVFNQVVAAYIFFSMLASGGINFSILRAIAKQATDREACAAVLVGAVIPTIVLSGVMTAAFWFSADTIAGWLQSEAVAQGMRAVSVGLFFFAINKVLISAVNGLRRMRAFAVFQALRWLLVLLGLLMAVALSAPGPWLAGVFTFGETTLFVLLVIEVSRQLPWWRQCHWQPWVGQHLAFGVKSVLSGVLLELNSRVDILMLGYFLDDAKVGVYSYAALFAEGFFQVLVVLKNNYNPILARYIADRRLEELQQIIHRGRNRTYIALFVTGLVAVLVYPVLLDLLTNKPDFQLSKMPFSILVAGIVLAAGYLPFQNLLSMANFPAWHSLLIGLVVLFNIIANATLIPVWGING
ncbi:MAG TPA: hypothetical protein ENK16_07435, partial [Chromatiales bacterium]|nr:hypothetical protein [Chromatiales bacterium]